MSETHLALFARLEKHDRPLNVIGRAGGGNLAPPCIP